MSTDSTLSRTLVFILAIVLLFPLLMLFMIFLPMAGLSGGGHMWNGHMWGDGGLGWVWLIMWVGALAVFLGIGYLLYRATLGGSDRRTDPAIEELRRAYARGDISDEEFERRRERLRRDE